VAGRVLDREEFAEGRLLEGKADFGLLGQILEGGLGIVDEPVQLYLVAGRVSEPCHSHEDESGDRLRHGGGALIALVHDRR